MLRSVGAVIDIDREAGGFTVTSFAVLLALLVARQDCCYGGCWFAISKLFALPLMTKAACQNFGVI